MNIKLALLISCGLVTMTHADVDNNPMLAGYRNVIAELFNSMPPEQQREPSLAPAEWRNSEMYKELVKMSPGMWQQVIANMDDVAPSPPMRTIVFQSFEGLPPKEYLEFLNKALDLCEQGRISGLEFEGVFMPPGRMRFFLSYNYKDPQVAIFLKRVQQARISEGIAANIADYLSGKQMQRDIAMRKMHPDIFASQQVPLLTGGYAPPDPEPSLTPDPMSAPIWLNEQRAADKSASPALGPDEQSTPQPAASSIPAPAVMAEKSQAATEIKSRSRFPVLPAAILAAAIVGVIVFLLRRKSS